MRLSQSLRVSAVAVGLFHVLASAPAYARRPSEVESLRSERSLGTVALNLGKYDDAVEHFARAYSIGQDPALLFSLAQAYRLGGKADKALATYSAFLRAVGNNSKYRGQVERAADEIESLTSFMLNHPVDSRKASPPMAATDPAPPAKDTDNTATVLEPPTIEKPVEDNPTVVPAKVATAVPLPQPEMPQPPALVIVSEKTATPESKDRPVYGRWWFWTGVASAIAAGTVAAWYYSQPGDRPPASTYGSVRVLP